MRTWLLSIAIIGCLAYVGMDQFHLDAQQVSTGVYAVEKFDPPFAPYASVDPSSSYHIVLDYPTTVRAGNSLILNAKVMFPQALAAIPTSIKASLIVIDADIKILPDVAQIALPNGDGTNGVSWVVALPKGMKNWRGLVIVDADSAPVARTTFDVMLKQTVVETVEGWGKSAVAIITAASSVLLALKLLWDKLKKPAV